MMSLLQQGKVKGHMTCVYRVLGLAAVRLGFAGILVCATLTDTWAAKVPDASGCTSAHKKKAVTGNGLRTILQSHSRWLMQW